jgi:hypothetical protein
MLLYLIKEMGSGARPHLSGAKVRHKFLFIPATSSEFFVTDSVAIAITNENVLGAFGDKLACET